VQRIGARLQKRRIKGRHKSQSAGKRATIKRVGIGEKPCLQKRAVGTTAIKRRAVPEIQATKYSVPRLINLIPFSFQVFI